MPENDIQLDQLKVVGTGSCVGGKYPDPVIDRLSPLVFDPFLTKHPGKVSLEDGSASVEDVALALAVLPDLESLAAKFGTTPEHVRQAIDYAVKAGFLGV